MSDVCVATFSVGLYDRSMIAIVFVTSVPITSVSVTSVSVTSVSVTNVPVTSSYWSRFGDLAVVGVSFFREERNSFFWGLMNDFCHFSSFFIIILVFPLSNHSSSSFSRFNWKVFSLASTTSVENTPSQKKPKKTMSFLNFETDGNKKKTSSQNVIS